jgi:2-iminobutanoate/2-iminopropanoate deaminase
MAKTAISTESAPAPAANYSQGVRKGNILQVAGQVPIDPKTGAIVGATVTEQTRQVFANLNAILDAAGSGLDDVLMLRVYLTDTAHFAEFNAVFAEFVTEPFAARTTIYCGLAPNMLVEIDALAVLGD